MFILQITTDDPASVMPRPSAVTPEKKANDNPYAGLDLSQEPTSTTTTTRSDGTTPSSTTEEDSFIPRGMGRYLVYGSAPLAAAVRFTPQMATISSTWRSIAQGSQTYSGITSRIPLVTRFTSWLGNSSRFAGFASRTTGFLARAGQYLGGVKYLGGALRVGGRALPVAGAVLAVGDNIFNWHQALTLEKQEGESDEAFKDRKTTAVTDAAINTGCTAAGAVIGGVIGSIIPGAGTFLGACIGAGIGNLVGRAFQSDGIGRTIVKGIGRFFGFG